MLVYHKYSFRRGYYFSAQKATALLGFDPLKSPKYRALRMNVRQKSHIVTNAALDA